MNRRERSDLLSQLRRDARSIAGHFQLQVRGIVAEHPRVKARYGACYENGLIKIRLNHAKTGKPLKYSSLIDTLCHELAHLRHFDHGPEFKAFYFKLLRWARAEGIYQPRASSTGKARQGVRWTGASSEARPFAQTLLHRHGIPIFPPLEPLGSSLAHPWENGRDHGLPLTNTAGTERSTPVAAPLVKAPQANRPPRAPEQLSLF